MNRSGVICVKLGMSRIFDNSGTEIPVTLLYMPDNYVVGYKETHKHGYNAIIIGAIPNKPERLSKARRGICQKAGIPAVKVMREFRISSGLDIEVGTKMEPSYFAVGQKIDVSGVTIGKGFAGVMKRHNFGGLEASHGVSVSHRSHGATGQRQDPGKVFKNKKMAGHMGGKKVTMQNLEVVAIDDVNAIISIRGAVPGAENGIVLLRDALKFSYVF